MNRAGPPLLTLLILGLWLGPAPVVRASQQGVVAMQKWKAMDLCAREAQTAFPDFTTEAQARRDAKLKECLAARNLPPREPLVPGR